MLDTLIDKGVEPARWLIVAAIAYSLATTIWVFFETPVATAPEPVARANAPSTAVKPVNINWILNQHMFGEAGAIDVSEVVQDDEPLERTRLNLTLQSVFVADIPEMSTAIISEQRKKSQLYKVGDTVPGNAKLAAVEHDQVILSRAGSRESLPFPVADGNGQLSAEPVDTAQPNTVRQPVRQTQRLANRDAVRRQPPANNADDLNDLADPQAAIDAYRDELEDDPEAALDRLGIETTDEGGYRIGDLAKSGYLRQTGLQSGDIILSVNGQPVGDLQQDQMQLDNILGQGSARIEVQRGNRRFFITARIPSQR